MDGLFVGVLFFIKDFVLYVGGVVNDGGLWLLVGCYVLFVDSELMVCFKCVGFVIFGWMMMFEFGFNVMMELLLYGLICNLWNFVYSVGGLSGGLVVVVVVGIVLVVYVNDGGGLICVLVVVCGFVGLKLLCGCMLVGLDYNLLLFGFGIEFVVMCMVCDSVVMFDVVEGLEIGVMFDIVWLYECYVDVICMFVCWLCVVLVMCMFGVGVMYLDCVVVVE